MCHIQCHVCSTCVMCVMCDKQVMCMCPVCIMQHSWVMCDIYVTCMSFVCHLHHVCHASRACVIYVLCVLWHACHVSHTCFHTWHVCDMCHGHPVNVMYVIHDMYVPYLSHVWHMWHVLPHVFFCGTYVSCLFLHATWMHHVSGDNRYICVMCHVWHVCVYDIYVYRVNACHVFCMWHNMAHILHTYGMDVSFMTCDKCHICFIVVWHVCVMCASYVTYVTCDVHVICRILSYDIYDICIDVSFIIYVIYTCKYTCVFYFLENNQNSAIIDVTFLVLFYFSSVVCKTSGRVFNFKSFLANSTCTTHTLSNDYKNCNGIYDIMLPLLM